MDHKEYEEGSKGKSLVEKGAALLFGSRGNKVSVHARKLPDVGEVKRITREEVAQALCDNLKSSEFVLAAEVVGDEVKLLVRVPNIPERIILDVNYDALAYELPRKIQGRLSESLGR